MTMLGNIRTKRATEVSYRIGATNSQSRDEKTQGERVGEDRERQCRFETLDQQRKTQAQLAGQTVQTSCQDAEDKATKLNGGYDVECGNFKAWFKEQSNFTLNKVKVHRATRSYFEE